MTQPSTPLQWRLSIAGAISAAVGIGLAAFGLVIGRPDVACLGAAIVMSMLWNWSDRRPEADVVQVAPARHLGAQNEVAAVLSIAATPSPGALSMRVTSAGYRDVEVVAAVGRPRQIRLALSMARTGEHRVLRVDRTLVAGGAVGLTAVQTDDAQRLLVLPGTRSLRELPLPMRLQGLTGAHSSRRPGDGGDLRDVNLFTPGDRLRRIDWRVTARRTSQHGGEIADLYVRRDFATADAIVMLVVDSRDEIGPDVSTWSSGQDLRPDEATSLDLAREAAASLARRYLGAGDRVGLDDLGRQSRPVPPAGGQAQLRRLVHRLAVLAPEGTPKPFLRAPQVPSGSLVIVFSTFLDDEAAHLAQLWRRSGHRVLAIDVLPTPSLAHLALAVQTALRVIEMERQDRIGDLLRAGVEVVRWANAEPNREPGADATIELATLARIRMAHR